MRRRQDRRLRWLFHVAAQLVLAAGQRFQRDEGIARCRVALDGDGQLDGSQAPVARPRCLRRGVGERAAVIIEASRQRVVDQAFRRRPAANDGEVGLFDLVGLELAGQRARHLGLEGEQQHARGAAVEAMHGLHAAAWSARPAPCHPSPPAWRPPSILEQRLD